MIDFLSKMPVDFINGVTPPVSSIIIFCANLFGILAITTALVFIVLHPMHIKSTKNILSLFRARVEEIFILCFSTAGAYVISVLAKNYFKVARPFVLDTSIVNLIPESGYAFPSSHATVFMALGVALFFMHKRIGAVFIFGALIIGVARVLSGVHTPLQVLAGYILGFVFALITAYIFRFIDGRKRKV